MRIYINSELLKTPGFKVIMTYILVTYLPSFFSSLIITNDFRESFNGFEENTFWVLPLILTLFVIACLLIQSNAKSLTGILFLNFHKLCPYQYKLFNYLMALTYLMLSIRFYFEFGLSFVHSGTSMSDVSSYIILFYSMKPIVIYFLFYEFLRLLNSQTIFTTDRLLLSILAIASVFGLSGSMEIIFLSLIFFFILIPPSKKVNLFMGNTRRINFKTVLTYFLSFIIGICVIFVGYANKLGTEKSLDLFTDSNVRVELIKELFIRFGNSYASLICMVNNHLIELSLQVKAIKIPIEVFKFRLSVLFNLEFQKPEIFNVSRLNYLTTYKDFHLKAGASPGLLASTFFLPLFPLNILILILILKKNIESINDAIPKEKRVSILGIILIFIFTIPLFESPIDYLIIFDPSVMALFFYFSVLSKFRKDNFKSRLGYNFK